MATGNSVRRMSPTVICVTACQILFMSVNIAFLGAGGFLLGVSLYTLTDHRVPLIDEVKDAQLPDISTYSEYETVEGKLAVKVVCAGAIIAGTWLTLIGLLGVLGVILGSRCVLFQYGSIMVSSFLAILFLGLVVIYAERTIKPYRHIVKGYAFGIREFYDVNEESDNIFSRMVDRVQVELSCCGMYNYTTEFQSYSSDELNYSGNVVPKSCCILDTVAYKGKGIFILQDEECLRNPTLFNSYVHYPCSPKIKAWLKRNFTIWLGVWLIILSAQLFLVALSFALGILG